MTEIRFYHLENQRIENALPALINKALETGHRILIKTNDKDRVKKLNEFLWTFDPNSFVPHGSKTEGHEADQPVYLTHEDENPNNADMILLIDAANTPPMENIKLCCNLFDGRTPETLNKARAQWKSFKKEGLTMTYWQQGVKGWEKKAS